MKCTRLYPLLNGAKLIRKDFTVHTNNKKHTADSKANMADSVTGFQPTDRAL